MARKDTLQFSAPLEESHNRLWGSHLRVPAAVAEALIEGKSRRVLCSLNGSPERQCALLPFGRGSYVVAVNKTLRNTLRLDIGTMVDVSLKKDRSKYGLPMPEELQEVLRQDKEGEHLFHALTAGKRRTLLHIVGSLRGTDRRIASALVIIRHLKINNGRINYRQLSQQLRPR